MSPAKRKRLLLKLIPYIAIWSLGGFIYTILEVGILGDHPVYPSTGNAYDKSISLIGTLPLGLAFGLCLWAIEEVLLKSSLNGLAFVSRVLLKTVIYISAFLVILFISTFIFNSAILQKDVFDLAVKASVFRFFGSFVMLSIVFYCGSLITLSLFFSEIVDYLGQDVVSSFFTGKYARPVVEKRIFMFLDMNGSTTLAEKLGHENYYRLVNQYYQDMTNAISNTEGEIYQYVGDEVVISWNMKSGLRNNNCIQCYFSILEAVQANEKSYLDKFGEVPTFKAAVHYGTITRGEVGVIKKEMLFTGDVLNTTARMQSLCNELNVSLLISFDLKSQLKNSDYHFIDKGTTGLRGRNTEIQLFEVRSN